MMPRKWRVSCSIYRGDKREDVEVEGRGATPQIAKVDAVQRLERENPGCHVMAKTAAKEGTV